MARFLLLEYISNDFVSKSDTDSLYYSTAHHRGQTTRRRQRFGNMAMCSSMYGSPIQNSYTQELENMTELLYGQKLLMTK